MKWKKINLYSALLGVLTGLVICFSAADWIGVNTKLGKLILWAFFSVLVYFEAEFLNIFNDSKNTSKKDLQKDILKQLVSNGILEIPLENMSNVWCEKPVEVNFKKLTKRWRDERKIDMEKRYKQINSAELRQLYEVVQSKIVNNCYLEVDSNGREIITYKDSYFLKNTAIQKLLIELDKNGDCPSVVNSNSDNEPDTLKKRDSLKTFSTWEILKTISLSDHTKNVVQKIIDIVLDKKQEMSKLFLEDAIIVALAHDIGKAHPDNTNPHPVISAKILKSILKTISIPKDNTSLIFDNKTINTLAYVVRDHHKKTIALSDDEKEDIYVQKYETLLNFLKKADKIARQEEVEKITKRLQSNMKKNTDEENKAKAEEKKEFVENGLSIITQPATLEKPKPFLKDFESITKIVAPLPNKTKDFIKKDIKIEWLDNSLDDIVRLIESRINLVKVINGNPYYPIFSLKDTVFVLGITFIKIMFYFAKKNNDIELSKNILTDENYRKTTALMLIDKLKESGYINQNEIKPGFFGGYFEIIRMNYNSNDTYSQKGFYTPLLLKTFAEQFHNGNTSVYENRKKSPYWDPTKTLITLYDYRIAS